MLVTLGRIADGKAGWRRDLRRGLLPRRRFERSQRGERDRSRSDETHPFGRGMDREAAEDARMGETMMTEGQQNDFDANVRDTGRLGLGADEERLRLVGDAMKNRIEFFAIGVAPEVEK